MRCASFFSAAVLLAGVASALETYSWSGKGYDSAEAAHRQFAAASDTVAKRHNSQIYSLVVRDDGDQKSRVSFVTFKSPNGKLHDHTAEVSLCKEDKQYKSRGAGQRATHEGVGHDAVAISCYPAADCAWLTLHALYLPGRGRALVDEGLSCL